MSIGLQSLKESLRFRIGRLRSQPTGRDPKGEYSIGYSNGEIVLDKLKIERYGLLRLEGWVKTLLVETPRCFIDTRESPLLQFFGTYRPDIAALLGSKNFFHGVELQYRVAGSLTGTAQLKIKLGTKVIFDAACPFQIGEPHYGGLLNIRQVLH